MPDILSPAELNDLRRTIRDLTMPGTALVLRGSLMPNGLGGYTQVWGTASYGGTTEVPVRYTTNTPSEQQIAGRVMGVANWTVVFPAEWDIRQTDRVYLVGPNVTLAVQGVIAPKTWELNRRVACTELRD